MHFVPGKPQTTTKKTSIPQSHLSVPCLQSQCHLENFDDSEFSHLAKVKNENHHIIQWHDSPDRGHCACCHSGAVSLLSRISAHWWVRHSGSHIWSSLMLRPTTSSALLAYPLLAVPAVPMHGE